jgi:hypothetical protein
LPPGGEHLAVGRRASAWGQFPAIPSLASFRDSWIPIFASWKQFGKPPEAARVGRTLQSDRSLQDRSFMRLTLRGDDAIPLAVRDLRLEPQAAQAPVGLRVRPMYEPPPAAYRWATPRPREPRAETAGRKTLDTPRGGSPSGSQTGRRFKSGLPLQFEIRPSGWKQLSYSFRSWASRKPHGLQLLERVNTPSEHVNTPSGQRGRLPTSRWQKLIVDEVRVFNVEVRVFIN